MGWFDECETLEEAVYRAVEIAVDAGLGKSETEAREEAQKVAEDLLLVIRSWMSKVLQTPSTGVGSMPETVRAEDARLREEFYSAQQRGDS